MKIGPLGESVACRFLREHGYIILERTYLKPWGEIDIVAEKKGVIHFYEVKTVSRELGGGEGIDPSENLHEEKVKRVMRAVNSYLTDRRVPARTKWQLDAALLVLDVQKKAAKIEILENIGL